MKIAIYPGSFDPVTSGHLNIIRRAANIFDKLIVCVMVNAGKNPMFTLEERVDLIRRVTRDLPNVEAAWVQEGAGDTPHSRSGWATSSKVKSSECALLNSREEIPHVQGKRNPIKAVGVPRGHQRADTLQP